MRDNDDADDYADAGAHDVAGDHDDERTSAAQRKRFGPCIWEVNHLGS